MPKLKLLPSREIFTCLYWMKPLGYSFGGISLSFSTHAELKQHKQVIETKRNQRKSLQFENLVPFLLGDEAGSGYHLLSFRSIWQTVQRSLRSQRAELWTPWTLNSPRRTEQGCNSETFDHMNPHGLAALHTHRWFDWQFKACRVLAWSSDLGGSAPAGSSGAGT